MSKEVFQPQIENHDSTPFVESPVTSPKISQLRIISNRVRDAVWNNRGYLKGAVMAAPLLLTGCTLNQEVHVSSITIYSQFSGLLWLAEEIVERDDERNIPRKILSATLKYMAGVTGCYGSLQMYNSGFAPDTVLNSAPAVLLSAGVIAKETSLPQFINGLGRSAVDKGIEIGGNIKENIKSAHQLSNEYYELERAIINANRPLYTKRDQQAFDEAVGILAGRYKLDVYEKETINSNFWNNTFRRDEIGTHYKKDGDGNKIPDCDKLRELKSMMGPDGRLDMDEAKKIIEKRSVKPKSTPSETMEQQF